jgi:hypothetical protein
MFHTSLKFKIVIVLIILIVAYLIINIIRFLIPLILIAIVVGWVWNLLDRDKK